jgi:hypothetical protein
MKTQSTEHNTMMVASSNKWTPLVLQSVRWRRWREELLAMGWELIIYIEQRLWLPSGVLRRPTPPTAQCRTSFFCKNPFRINRTIELMDCKHYEGTGRSERFFLIPPQYFCQLFLSFTPRGGWKAFYGTASKKTASLLCVQVHLRTKSQPMRNSI